MSGIWDIDCLRTVYGKEEGMALESARVAHIDYTAKGLKDSLRHCRKDVCLAARDFLDAEDAGRDTQRCVAFSVWRPVKPVKCDPLAVCDWRMVNKSELEMIDYRALSDVNADAEYILEAHAILPPMRPEGQKWYWTSEQKENEVLMIKFAATAAEKDANIAGGCPHLSPIVPGTEEEEPRSSIECRVFAFW